MSVVMITIATNIIDRAFKVNEGSAVFLRRLIVCLILAGIVFGVVGCYISKLVWLVEVLIAPALLRAIKSYQSIVEKEANILAEANKTLAGARAQNEAKNRIKREKTNE